MKCPSRNVDITFVLMGSSTLGFLKSCKYQNVCHLQSAPQFPLLPFWSLSLGRALRFPMLTSAVLRPSPPSCCYLLDLRDLCYLLTKRNFNFLQWSQAWNSKEIWSLTLATMCGTSNNLIHLSFGFERLNKQMDNARPYIKIVRIVIHKLQQPVQEAKPHFL